MLASARALQIHRASAGKGYYPCYKITYSVITASHVVFIDSLVISTELYSFFIQAR